MGYFTKEKAISVVVPVFILISVLSLFSCNSGGAGPPFSGPGTSGNSAPIANAGNDQNVATGTLAVLDGSLSSDTNGDMLTYAWSFTARPVGSTAALSSAYSVYPTFIVDKAGVYQIRLVVNDGQVNSTADTVTVTATASSGNSAPYAYAGLDQSVKTGATVNLDGSGSFDVDGDPLTYAWSFSSKPAASTAVLSNATSINPSFTADKNGPYVIQLVVNDGYANSYAVGVTVTAATPVLVSVPDTGQTGDYTALFGEDSDYLIHPPSYTVNGDGTVTDAVTGLMWQQQDDGTTRDWATAMSYCDTLAVGGHSGWRLPDNRELLTIADYGTSNPSIDTTAFPNTRSSYYWTSTEFNLDTTNAWDVMFDIGVNDTSRIAKTKTHYVRCVRGSESRPVLTDNGDGTVTDETSSLVWQKTDDNVGRVWTDALTYCEGLSLAGQTDWRLPNIKELMSLIDYRFSPYTIDTAYFTSVPTGSLPAYWSSTTVFSNTNQGLAVRFLSGLVSNPGKSTQAFARCVRGQ
jgi:hypothetical protein